jgi:hypothetical protein
VQRSGHGPIYHVKPEEQQIRNRYIPNTNEGIYSSTQTPVCWITKLHYPNKTFTAQYSEHWKSAARNYVYPICTLQGLFRTAAAL